MFVGKPLFAGSQCESISLSNSPRFPKEPVRNTRPTKCTILFLRCLYHITVAESYSLVLSKVHEFKNVKFRQNSSFFENFQDTLFVLVRAALSKRRFSIELWWNDIDRANWSTRRKASPSSPLSTTRDWIRVSVMRSRRLTASQDTVLNFVHSLNNVQNSVYIP
jgi:hypothetical protein